MAALVLACCGASGKEIVVDYARWVQGKGRGLLVVVVVWVERVVEDCAQLGARCWVHDDAVWVHGLVGGSGCSRAVRAAN